MLGHIGCLATLHLHYSRPQVLKSLIWECGARALYISDEMDLLLHLYPRKIWRSLQEATAFMVKYRRLILIKLFTSFDCFVSVCRHSTNCRYF